MTDPLAIRPRLMEFLNLEPGWLNGEGTAYEREQLDWLADGFDAYYPGDLPRPYIHPSWDSPIWAEFYLPNNCYIEAYINLATKTAEIGLCIDQTRRDVLGEIPAIIDLSTATGWGDWARLVRSIMERSGHGTDWNA